MKEYTTYLFDLDGTLVDSLESLYFVFIESFKQMGIKCEKHEVQPFLRQALTKTYVEKGGDIKDIYTFAKWIDLYLITDETVKKNKIYSEVKSSLEVLINKGKTLGVVTSNDRNHAINVLKHVGLPIEYFKVIVGNKETSKHKPNPEPILKALELLDIKDKDSVVYVGDALDDMICANNSNISHILIDRNNEYLDYKEEKIKDLGGLINE